MAENTLIGQQIQGYHIVQKLGSGGYGTVYLGEKEDLGKKYQTAIKHISMPDAEGYESILQDYGYDKAATQAHFEKMVEGITAEINTLLELSKKDNRHIVAYYDHDIQRSESPLRFDIFLRMEYLTPLASHVRRKGFTLGEVIKLGLNMCDALSLCHNSGVMHRDIKEANIFISENGNFKLGDFGVAKAVFEATQAGSIKGTASYMAPEIYLREPYDSSVDIYSLGIVLYKLLNNQRLPFMPDAPAPFTVDDRNLAETRRLKGEVPPLPANAKNKLGEIVVKACSVKTDRYTKAEEFKFDLQSFLKTISREEYNTVVIPQSLDEEDSGTVSQSTQNSYTQTQGATMTMGVQNNGITPSTVEQNPYAETGSKKGKKKGKKKFILAGIAAVLVIAAGIAAYVMYLRFSDPVNQFQSALMERDYNGAGRLFREELKDGDTEKLEQVGEFVVSQADDVKNQYINGEIEYEDALAQLQELEKLGIVNKEELEPMITEVNELRTSRAAYENAQTNIEISDWKSAINELRKVIQADSNYADAQVQLADAIRQYKEDVLAETSNFDVDKDYNGAITALQAALQIVPDDADFLTRIKDFEKKIEDDIRLEIDGIIRDAKSAVSVSADYAGALGDLRAASKQYPNSEEIKTTISEIEEEYLEKVLAEAEAIAIERKYVEAVTVLNNALQVLPDNTSIKATISEYEAKYPALLQQLVYFTGRALTNGGQGKDNMQGTQTNVIETDDGGRFDNTYKLEGKYIRIKGVLYQPFDRRSDTRTRTLEIFGDGRLLYSATMRGGIEPILFDVDISGVSDLEVRFLGSYSYARLANVELYQ